MIKRTSKIHLSVWLSAIFFSAIHLDFFGFFPRIMLGAVLGYAFVFSKSLWIPIVLHFLNNATIVVAYYFYQKEWISTDPLTSDTLVPLWAVALSLIASVALLWFIINRYNNVRSNSAQMAQSDPP
jgi:hypothetical protein